MCITSPLRNQILPSIFPVSSAIEQKGGERERAPWNPANEFPKNSGPVTEPECPQTAERKANSVQAAQLLV